MSLDPRSCARCAVVVALFVGTVSCGASTDPSAPRLDPGAAGAPGGAAAGGASNGPGGAGGASGGVGAAGKGGSVAFDDACPMGTSAGLPAASPRILVIGPAIAGPDLVATHLHGLLAADAAFVSPEVVSQKTDTAGGASLASYWYAPTDRDARLAALKGPFTWVVLLDSAAVALDFVELSFEGTRAVACGVRASGAKPIVLMSWSSDPGEAAKRGEVAYRVGNGTGSPVVPAGFAWAAADKGAGAAGAGGGPAVPAGPNAAAAFVAAASLYSAITGKSAAGTTYVPPGAPAAQQASWLGVAADAVAQHATMTHYTSPFPSAVKLQTVPSEPEFWFMDAGTSSEAIWEARMNEILPRVGLVPRATAIGGCNPMKTFDAPCLDTAVTSFASAPYRLLFARDYSVSASAIAAAAKQSDLTAQVWDRHYDALPNDGLAAMDTLESRSMYAISEARKLGLAWVPHHLAFAKLKTARPTVQLTSDGTHVTDPVGYGLAAMSVVSRTSRAVPTAGLDADTAAAVGFATQTVVQLSSLSQSGELVADDPATRPKITP